MIIEKGFEEETVNAFYDFLINKIVWDRIILDDASEQSISIQLLLGLIKGDKLRFSIFVKYACPFMYLPDSFSQFMALPDRQYKVMVQEKDMKKLENYQVDLKCAKTQEEVEVFLRRMFEIHKERWNNLGKRGSFSDERKKMFYRNVSKDLLENGALDLAALEIDGNAEVIRYGMVWGKSYFSLQGGISKKGLELRAGNILTLKVFELICGKIKSFHFLRGSEAYKYLWGCHDGYTVVLDIGRTLRGGAALYCSRVSNQLKTCFRMLANLKKKAIQIAKKYENARARLFIKIERWLEKARLSGDAAVVLGSNVSALSFVRSLARKKVKILMLASQKDIAAFTSLAKVILLPSIEEKPALWLDCLNLIGEKLEGKGVLFAMSDEYLLFLARHSKRLGIWFKFNAPDLTILERIVNKRLQYKMAESAGLKMPQTFYPSSEKELLKLKSLMKYPCLLKPYKSYIGRRLMEDKVVLINSEEELFSQFRETKNLEVHFMIQEIIPGEDSDCFGYQAYWNESGEEISWMTYRTLRQYPKSFGDVSYQEEAHLPHLKEVSHAFLKTLNYRGMCSIEYKKDSRDGSYYFITMNAGSPLSIHHAITSGRDFPWTAFCSLSKKDLAEDDRAAVKTDIYFMNEILEFNACLKETGSRIKAFGQWLPKFRRAKAKAVWSLRDPLPFIRILRGMLRLSFGGVKNKGYKKFAK
jgi:D-aspartate ligase